MARPHGHDATAFGSLVALSFICGGLFYRVIASLLKPVAPGSQ